jgi:RNA polymerase sigma-70 factor (ECF subfamily)
MFRSANSPKNKKDMAGNPSDARLIEAYVKEGDLDKFGMLFERYTHLVYGVCMKYLKNSFDAEDAVMDIFEKLMHDLREHDVMDFRNWLYRVSKNHCLMILRRHKVKQRSEEVLENESRQQFMEILFGEHLPVEEDDKGKLLPLHRALESLGKGQRKCIELFYFEKRSYSEIAGMTGYSMKQVKSHIQNAKRNLKKILVPE